MHKILRDDLCGDLRGDGACSRSRLAFGVGRWLFAALALFTCLTLFACAQTAADRDYNYDNPIDPGADPEVEILWVSDDRNVVILLSNETNIVQLSGWVLENIDDDSTSATYTFPSFQLDPGDVVYVRTTSGTNDENNLYTGSDLTTWESDDVLILLDGAGREIDSCDDEDDCWGD